MVCKSNVFSFFAFILYTHIYLQMLLYGCVFGSHEVNEFTIFIHPDLDQIEHYHTSVTAVNLNKFALNQFIIMQTYKDKCTIWCTCRATCICMWACIKWFSVILVSLLIIVFYQEISEDFHPLSTCTCKSVLIIVCLHKLIILSYTCLENSPKKARARWLVKNCVCITRWRHRTSAHCWCSDDVSKENLHFGNQS